MMVPLGHWLFPSGKPNAKWGQLCRAWSLDVSAAGPLPLNYDLRRDQPWGPQKPWSGWEGLGPSLWEAGWVRPGGVSVLWAGGLGGMDQKF